MQYLWVVGLALLAIPGTILLGRYFFWREERINSLLERGARQFGFKMIDKEFRRYLCGPFLWTIFTAHLVFRVTVEDAKGRRQKGWICLGLSFSPTT